MIPVPTEEELTSYLQKISEFTHLPPWSELEPGSFLYYVKEIWEREQDRDGRRGHLSESEIATAISQQIGKKFTRNQYQAAFGAGRREQKQKAQIPRDVSEAFLKVAFNNWSSGNLNSNTISQSGFERILPDENMDIDLLVSQICHRIYSPGIPVRCIPATGLGPIGFHRQCRKDNCSIIVATEREHIIMNDPGTGLFDWLENIRTFFRDIEKEDTKAMHIWVVREPIISNDPRSLTSLYFIGRLRTAFMAVRAMCLSRDSFPSWEQLSQRSIIVVQLNKNNNKHRTTKYEVNAKRENPIEDDFIFPNEVPWPWKSQEENLSVSDLNFITTIHDLRDDEIKVEYNIFLHKENSRIPPVVKKSSPSKDSDRSFRNLYIACRSYSDYINGADKSETLW